MPGSRFWRRSLTLACLVIVAALPSAATAAPTLPLGHAGDRFAVAWAHVAARLEATIPSMTRAQRPYAIRVHAAALIPGATTVRALSSR
jgi:hypothetical protein